MLNINQVLLNCNVYIGLLKQPDQMSRQSKYDDLSAGVIKHWSYLQCVSGFAQQRMSISVPLVVWDGNAKGRAAEGESLPLSDSLGCRVYSNMELPSPGYWET